MYMPNVTVTFRNPVTGETMPNTQLDDLITVREAVQNLQEANFVPAPKPGQHYVLEIKGKTELSSDEATLASGGITDNDTVNVVLAQRGGSGW
jgi:uncharacterized ubiquitin-like protein YukD